MSGSEGVLVDSVVDAEGDEVEKDEGVACELYGAALGSFEGMRTFEVVVRMGKEKAHHTLVKHFLLVVEKWI